MASNQNVHRKILNTSQDFKRYWKTEGPFAYALTSIDYPPVMLDPEEWLFSNDLTALLKVLVQYDPKKMKIVKIPFNPDKTSILRPEKLSFWKINHFPKEWEGVETDYFAPEGHMTLSLFEALGEDPEALYKSDMTAVFFKGLKLSLEQLGYRLLSPRENSKFAAVHTYLKEWEEDESEAGIH